MNIRSFLTLATALTVAGCVTVNVYFPASAAEQAADRFVKDVYGKETAAPAPAAGDGNPQGAVGAPHEPLALALGERLLNLVLPAAHAQQPDINISTPAINSLKSAMESRHRELLPYYRSGAVGMAANGLIVLRDPKAVELTARNTVKQLVAQENADRNRLYAEIAKANAHPEWEPQIRSIFAGRWVANAPSGWWYQNAGNWQTK